MIYVVIEHSGVVPADVFIQVAADNEVTISAKDQNFLKQNLNSKYHYPPNRIFYEEAIKDLVLVPLQSTSLNQAIQADETKAVKMDSPRATQNQMSSTFYRTAG